MIKAQNGSFYNVGSDEAITISKLAEKVRDILSPKKEIIYTNLNETKPKENRNLYVPDISKIKNELGLEVEIKLDDAIKWLQNF